MSFKIKKKTIWQISLLYSSQHPGPTRASTLANLFSAVHFVMDAPRSTARDTSVNMWASHNPISHSRSFDTYLHNDGSRTTPAAQALPLASASVARPCVGPQP
jgi:hypothetical protein